MLPFTDWPELMTITDVSEYCDFGLTDTKRMFDRKDFPTVNPEAKRYKRVGKYALQAYLNKGVPIHTT